MENARDFLAGLPGQPDFNVFLMRINRLRQLWYSGVDDDLLTTTNQYFVKNNVIAIKDRYRPVM